MKRFTVLLCTGLLAGGGFPAGREQTPPAPVLVCTADVPATGTAGSPVQFNITVTGYSAGDIYTTDSIAGNLRYVPAGTFTQGSATTEFCRNPDEGPRFTHTASGALAVMETEVTRKMWATLRGLQPALPADPKGTPSSAEENHPVRMVSWNQAVQFANLLSGEQGLSAVYYTGSGKNRGAVEEDTPPASIMLDPAADGYRLPYESEWEYFCRAGTITPFSKYESFYNNSTCASCGSSLSQLASVSWYCYNSGDTTHPAGQKNPNPWGLRDVHGNVWEWCQDWSGDYTDTPKTDYHGPATGSSKVLRGGSCEDKPWVCRSAYRNWRAPGSPKEFYGFRLVRPVTGQSKTEQENGVLTIGAGPDSRPSAVTYDWDFGDGSAHSNLQNPAHTYLLAGSFNWRGIVNANGSTCEKTGTIIIGNPADQPPAVLFTAPANGAVVSGTVTLEVSVTDDHPPVARVEFLADGVLQETDTSSPYSYNWNSQQFTDGLHTLRAVAIDSAGQPGDDEISLTVDNLTIPAAPSLLQVFSVPGATDRLNLTWKDNSTNESSFAIESGPASGGPWSLAGTAGAGIANFQHTGLAPGTLRYYRVGAANAKGSSGYSNTASGTTYHRGGNYTIGGYLGVGLESPERAIHIRGSNAVFRMDRSQNTAAFMIVRTTEANAILKALVVGVNAAGANNGSFVINDLGSSSAGSGLNRLTIDNDGNAIFGGQVRAASFTTVSASRHKTAIEPLTGALEQLLRLRAYRFNWRESGEPSLGFLAEEAAAILPETCQFFAGFPALEYSRFAPLLVESIRSQQNQLQELETRRDRLRALLDELRQARRELETKTSARQQLP